MKKILFAVSLFAAIFSVSSAVAQAPYKMNTPYTLPQTAIRVIITVQEEVIKKGPYAKFSQQYIGVTAPLNDKNSYTIVSTEMFGYNESDPFGTMENPILSPIEVDNFGSKESLASRGAISGMQFNDMGINPIVYRPGTALPSDRTSAREKSMEEMASEAATTIFTLRKRKFDLITGEIGENVFGAGLGAAISEIRRLEEEYIALFTGKASVTTKSYEFDIVPQQDKNSYIICRFSSQKGIVDATDMSGEPIAVTVTPEGRVKPVPTDKKTVAPKGPVSYYRLPDMAQCKLFNGAEMLESRRIAIYQFGTTATEESPVLR